MPSTSPSSDSARRLIVGGGDSDLDSRLTKELDAYNFAAVGESNLEEFTVRVVDPDEELVAGLSGWTWGTCAGIAMVWVREDSRKEGWGARMLDAAENLARERGCRQLLVSSFTFQAPDFYRRHGYVEFARSEGLPVEGAADVHFAKAL
jgi:GNAT superfamily N-acetyltransferase